MTTWWTFVSHGIAHIFVIIAVDVSLLCSQYHCRHWTKREWQQQKSRCVSKGMWKGEGGGEERYSVKKDDRTRRMTAYVYMRKVHRISLLFLSSYCTRVRPVCWSNRSLFQLSSSSSSSFTDLSIRSQARHPPLWNFSQFEPEIIPDAVWHEERERRKKTNSSGQVRNLPCIVTLSDMPFSPCHADNYPRTYSLSSSLHSVVSREEWDRNGFLVWWTTAVR